LSADTFVTLVVFDASGMPAPPAGQAYVLHAINLHPEGVTFDPPAVITFPYNPAGLGSSDPASLAIWVFINGSWQSLGGTIDPINHTTSVSVPHFTLYALMRRIAQPVLAAPPLAGPQPTPPSLYGGPPMVTGVPNAGAGDAVGHGGPSPIVLAIVVLALGGGIFGAGLIRRIAQPVAAPAVALPPLTDPTPDDGSMITTGVPNTGGAGGIRHRSAWPFILAIAVLAVGTGVSGVGFMRRRR